MGAEAGKSTETKKWVEPKVPVSDQIENFPFLKKRRRDETDPNPNKAKQNEEKKNNFPKQNKTETDF